MIKQTLLILLTLFWVNLSMAQNYNVSVNSYTLEDGLSHNQINWIHKDKKGMLWIGCFNGINRYDGQEFKYVAKVDFAHVDMVNIMEDEVGDLWLTEGRESNNLFFFNTITEEIKTFEEKFGVNPPFQKEQFLNAIVLANQTILVTLRNKQFVSFNLKDKAKKQIHDEEMHHVFSHPNANRYWIVNTNSAVLKGDDHVELFRIDDIPQVYHVINVTSKNHLIYKGVDNYVYTLTPSGELNNYDFDQDERIFHRFTVYDSLNQNADHIIQFVNGNFHLYNLERPESPILEKYIRELEVTFIYFILKEEQNIWIGTINGLFKIQIRASHFKKGLFKNPERFTQEEFNSCRGMMETEDGEVYVTTNEAIFNIKDGTPFIAKDKYCIHDVLITEDSILWTYNLIYNIRTDLKTGKQSIFTTEDFTSIGTWSFYQDSTGRIWGGTNLGLSYFEEGFKTFLRYKGHNGFSELNKSTVYEFFVDQQKRIWLATSHGLYQLDLKKGIVQRYWKGGAGKYSFPTNKLQHIHQDKAGVFWIASREGLIRWDEEQSKTRLFTSQDGFSNSNLNAVYEDDYGFLWMSSDNGIIQFQKETFKVKNYTLSDGISHPEFNRISHLQDSKGNIYFGGLNGVTYFHPRDFLKVFDEPVEIPLVLTECKIFSGESGKQEDRINDFHKNKKITLASDDRYLSLQFALLDYFNLKVPEYLYEIDGEAWEASKENIINLSALPYGEHTLTVKARTGNGFFSNQALSIPIVVLKPFYLQWWFITLSGLVLLSLIAFYQKIKTRRLLKRQEELEITVAERTQIIQRQSEELLALDKAKSRFLANISHELRTPLTLVLNTLKDDQVEKIIDATNDQVKYVYEQTDVNIMNRNAHRLQQLIDQLLDLSKLENGQMNLKASQEDFKTYLEEIVRTFQTSAQKKNIKLSFVVEKPHMPLYFERDKMDKIVYNLLSNAIKFTPEKGKIEIGLWQVGQKLSFSVSDSGIGIPEAEIQHVFNRFYQVKRKDEYAYEGTGLGLALVKELVEIHHGRVVLKSDLGKGASFKIELPVGSDHLLPEEIVDQEVLIKANEFQKIGEEHLQLDNNENKERSSTEHQPVLLVIEDNEDLRYHHQKTFGAEYLVVLAKDGNEGLEKALEIIPDIIVCDVMMPGKDGYQVCELLKTDERTNHVPVILLTAKAGHDNRLEGLTVGADDYITKPYDQEELKLRIRNQIKHVRKMQEQFSFQKNNVTDIKAVQPKDKFTQKLSDIIEENIANRQFGVVELSHALHLSRSQLFRKLKALTGNTPNNFLRSYRLNKAKELLIEEEGNATNVSYLVGFNNPNYFFKCFKDEFGMTPGQFMEQVYKD